jgi:Fe-S cluster assembly protein SufD
MKLTGFQDSPTLTYPPFTEAWRFSQLESFFQQDLSAAKPQFKATSHLEISGGKAQINALPKGVSIVETKISGSDFWTSLARSGVKYKIVISEDLAHPLKLTISREGQSELEATLAYLEIQVLSGVKATLQQEFKGTDQGHTHTETMIHLAPDSLLEHSLSFREGALSINTHAIKTKVETRARYEQTLITSDSQKTRLELLTELMGAESFAKLRSLSLLKLKSNVDLHSQIIHHSADTAADQLAKNLLDGDAKAIFTGRIKIVRDAQRVHSAQLNRNILKSKKAHAIGQPQLEIFADDVKCSHGSTTGRIGENELFYLLSRGISQQRAQELLSHAFIQEVFTENSADSKTFFTHFLEQL